MSTLGDVVQQLSAICDEMARASDAAAAAQDHLEQAIRLFGAVADGSGDDRVRALQHRVQEASTAAGEAARGLIHGNAAIETYIAQVAPAMARDLGPAPPPPVAGETLLQSPSRRSTRGVLRATVKHGDQLHDLAEFATRQVQESTEYARLPDDRGPTVAEVGWRPRESIPVLRADHSTEPMAEAVSSLVVTTVWIVAAVDIALKRLRRRYGGRGHG